MSDNGSDCDTRDETPGEGGGEVTDDTPLEEIPLSLDAMLDILANPRRRLLLEYLRDVPEQTCSFEEVTKYIIKQIAVRNGEQPNHDTIQIDLQHHHLPKLADAGIIEYDVRSQTIRYRQNDRLEALADQVRSFEAR